MSLLQAHLRLAQGGFVLDAQFQAPANSITALFGPSGAGKSTLLSALAGLKRAQGSISLKEREVSAIPPHRRGFGLVFQDARLFPHLTAGQNLTYARRRAQDSKLEVVDVAGFFDIAALLDRPVRNLSGGEKSRVALARALVCAPDFLLLDEPFAALDGPRRRAFIQVLLAAHQKFHIPMLVVSHSIDDAASLASHLVALKQGRVVAQGPFAQTALSPAFQALLDPRDIGTALSGDALRSAAHVDSQSLWLRADHVLIASEPPAKLSARNILEGRVAAMTPEADSSLLVELATTVGPVLARVTQEAALDLDLQVKKTAWAVIKAHAV
jgi:molybdate transport system ATP-binding protein